MKRMIAAAVFGFGLMATPAFADAMMPSSAGNTFVVTTANGTVLRYHFNADGTFDFVTPDDHTVAGTYTMADGQLCLTPQGGQASCGAYAGDKNVGDTWTQKAPTAPISVCRLWLGGLSRAAIRLRRSSRAFVHRRV